MDTFIIHTLWDGLSDKLILWGESLQSLCSIVDNFSDISSKNQKANGMGEEIPNHSFSLSAKDLEKILPSLFRKGENIQGNPKSYEIYLPLNSSPLLKQQQIPLPSPQLEKYTDLYFQNIDNTGQSNNINSESEKKEPRDYQSTNSESWDQFKGVHDSLNKTHFRRFIVEAIQIPITSLIHNVIQFNIGDTNFENNKAQIVETEISIVFDETFRFWEEATLFALSLLMKNSYYPKILPTIDLRENVSDNQIPCIVQWGVKLNIHLSQIFYELLRNFPPICLLP